MANVNIYNLTLIKQEKCNKKTINTTFNHYAELTLCTLPIMAKLNGQWILRDKWSTRLKKSDILEFHIMPQGGGGGGGSDLGRVVGMVAIAVAAYYTAGAASSWVASVGMSSTAASAVGAVTYAATMTVGTMALNTLIPVPEQKVASYYSEEASPTYSLSAQGNSARIGDAVPIIYGRHMVYSDYAAVPYAYYQDNDEYLNQLFMIGIGEYDIEQMRIEDTDISNFDEITYEIIEPGQEITLFDHNCVSCDEVSSQTLDSDYTGPFVLNSADTEVVTIQADFVAAGGLYYANDSGTLSSRSVTVVVEARLIDDDGIYYEEDSWVEVIRERITDATNTAVRKTFEATVEAGRYEVRCKRTDDEDEDETREVTAMSWAGLRGFIDQNINYDDMTLVAMKMKATDNLSSTTSRKVNFIVQRKLNTWSSENGWSEEKVATSSIAWAFADLCKNEYCGNLDDDKVDLEQLEYLDSRYSEIGDEFNAIFDSQVTLLEAFSKVGNASRTLAFIQGDKIHFIRDEEDNVPGMMFNAQNIVKDSWSIDYLLPTSETIDYAEVTFFNERTWTTKTIDVALDENKMTNKTQMTMFGITNEDQVIREARYYLLTNKYRRRVVSFDTELEGAIPTIGSLIKLSYPLPNWGTSGFVLDYDKESLTLELSEEVTMEDGKDYYISFRNSQGKAESAMSVSRSEDMLDTQVKLSEEPPCDIYTGNAKEKTHFLIGELEEVSIHAKVNSIVPSSDTNITITATIDDVRVYE